MILCSTPPSGLEDQQEALASFFTFLHLLLSFYIRYVNSFLPSRSQVTLIPTHDTEVTRDWYQQTHERQQELNIMVLASSSTVVMQDESFPACKIEF